MKLSEIEGIFKRMSLSHKASIILSYITDDVNQFHLIDSINSTYYKRYITHEGEDYYLAERFSFDHVEEMGWEWMLDYAQSEVDWNYLNKRFIPGDLWGDVFYAFMHIPERKDSAEMYYDLHSGLLQHLIQNPYRNFVKK